MRWYFLCFSSFSTLRSPVIESTPPSTVTLISSLVMPGNSALTVYSLSSSAISTGGDHSETVNSSSPPSVNTDSRLPSSEPSLFCISSNSRIGSHETEARNGFHFCIVFIFSVLRRVILVSFNLAQCLLPASFEACAPYHYETRCSNPLQGI